MRLWIGLLLLASGCATASQKLYSKAAATATYYEASYKARCKNTGGHFPASCGPCEAILARAAWQVQAAKTNVAIGYLDPKQSAELDQTTKDLASCP